MSTEDPEEIWGNTNKTNAEMRAYIREIVDEAPPLTDGQRAKLAELLRPIREARLVTRDDVELAG